MKKFLLSIALLCSLCINAQTTITTHSSCDSDCDGEVTVVDATNTVNKVIKKVANETEVVTAEQLNTLLNEVNTKLTDIQNRLQYLEKAGVYTYPFANGHEYVDLGLPSGTLWATCNIGAENPEDYGDYFAWGEIIGYKSGKTAFEWSTYKWCNGSYNTLTKYCTDSSFGTVDNKTSLESSDDAATVSWGDKWRMPTYTEQKELRTGCYWEWTSNYCNTGVAGYIVYKVKSDSDKGVQKYRESTVTTVGTYSVDDIHIFLPAAGWGGSGEYMLNSTGTTGNYWSKTLYIMDDGPRNAYNLWFSPDKIYKYDEDLDDFRCMGNSIRPVL